MEIIHPSIAPHKNNHTSYIAKLNFNLILTGAENNTVQLGPSFKSMIKVWTKAEL